MNYNLLSVAVLAIAAVAMPALADGAFSGGYVGGQIGGATAETKTTVASPAVGTTPAARASRSQDKTSVTGDVFAGYGVQLENNLYVGGEVALGRGGGKKTTTTLSGIATRQESGLRGSASGRVGYVFGENTMVYGRLGIEGRQDKLRTPAGRTSKTTVSGALLGLGVERNFSDSLVGRVEVQRADYGKKTFTGSAATAGVRTTYDPSETRLMIGAALRF